MVLPTAHVPLSSPRPGRPIYWEFIHQEGQGVYVHYWQGRTRPCVTAGTCDACAGNQNPRWRYYIGAVLWPKQEIVIADITEDGFKTLFNLLGQTNKLRGGRVGVGRKDARPNSRMTFKIDKSGRSPDQIPSPFDLTSHLLKIWGMRELYKEREGSR